MLELQVNNLYTTVVANAASSSNPSIQVFLNGALVTPTVTTTSLATGIWSVSFTPTATGVYTILGWGSVQDRINVVSRSLYSYLVNLEDESLGSWSWDKTTGVLQMVRQNGTALASFSVVDDNSISSRERT